VKTQSHECRDSHVRQQNRASIIHRIAVPTIESVACNGKESENPLLNQTLQIPVHREVVAILLAVRRDDAGIDRSCSSEFRMRCVSDAVCHHVTITVVDNSAFPSIVVDDGRRMENEERRKVHPLAHPQVTTCDDLRGVFVKWKVEVKVLLH